LPITTLFLRVVSNTDQTPAYSVSFCVTYISDAPLGFVIQFQNETLFLVMHGR